MFVWKSAGINVTNLVTVGATQGFDSYRSEVYSFIGLSILSVVYCVVMLLIGLCRVKLRAFVVSTDFGEWKESVYVIPAFVDYVATMYWVLPLALCRSIHELCGATTSKQPLGEAKRFGYDLSFGGHSECIMSINFQQC